MREDPLPSWNEGATKDSIRTFVDEVTTEGGSRFVPREARIATFDNDGTLWCEKPMYIQLDALLRRLAAQARDEPSLRQKQPWKAACEKDFEWLDRVVTKHYQGEDALLHVLLAGILRLSHDVPVEQVEASARTFVETQRHPTLDRLYRDCTYQPMLELLRFLEARGFTNYIVSGGGRDFMRGFASQLYGVPRERVIGSKVTYRYTSSDGTDGIVQSAELDVVDDGPGKPVQIWNVIGRRPIVAAGNSNGDLEMLTFAGGNRHDALRLRVAHDDGAREFAYSAGAERLAATAQTQGWRTVSVRNDWHTVFPSTTSS